MAMFGPDVEAEWIATDSPRLDDLSDVDGLWLAPGSPYADDGAVYRVIARAREHDVPFLGTCGGLQYAVIEFLRNVVGITDASHAEVDGERPSNAVTRMACSISGTRRTIEPVPGTRFDELVDGKPFVGTHFCSYAPTGPTIRLLRDNGMVVEAVNHDSGPDVLHLTSRRFFFLSLFQPQMGSSDRLPLHPLIVEFLDQARRVAADRLHGARGAVEA